MQGEFWFISPPLSPSLIFHLVHPCVLFLSSRVLDGHWSQWCDLSDWMTVMATWQFVCVCLGVFWWHWLRDNVMRVKLSVEMLFVFLSLCVFTVFEVCMSVCMSGFCSYRLINQKLIRATIHSFPYSLIYPLHIPFIWMWHHFMIGHFLLLKQI